MKKIVITGIGMITPVGNGKVASWNALKAGKSGIGHITKFDASRCTCQIAGELKDFDAYLAETGYVDRKAARHMDPFAVYGVAAAVEAWKDAGFTEENKPDMDRVGTFIGNGIGGMQTTGEAWKTLLERGPDRLSPFAIPQLIANEGAGNISMALGAKGPAQVVVTACASSTDALGIALDLMRAGRTDVMVAGGTEATILEFAVGGFMKMKALTTQFNDRPEKGSRPFNADRSGFVMGEG
ncbi:MAG: beta-ketoacyl-[acyl-carrier-protein] synthase II, partial [Kiritimatiellae bacterium]|nr:beta-ketoacyl-[acyl-carrier-protein] synthase II [Kiritimatiellia bacterium]